MPVVPLFIALVGVIALTRGFSGNTGRGSSSSPPPATPPNAGAWSQGEDGSWTWVRGATPDPGLVSLWGNGALTDIRRDPTGERNIGAWTPQHGGGWQWRWGVEPEERNLRNFSREALTNPDQLPNGGQPQGNTTRPPLPDVVPPTLDDAWDGTPPSVTGDVPEDESGGGEPVTLTEPPAHPMFTVSPGGIRDAETAILALINSAIAAYDGTSGAVSSSRSENVYTSDNRQYLLSSQDRLLLGVADVIRLTGEYVSRLNVAAQSYARADIDSFVPDL